ILLYEITDGSTHIGGGFAVEALGLRRREIEGRFPQCQAIVSLARGDEASLGVAKFRYSTLRHGELVREVPFVPIASFVEPALLVAQEGPSVPAGEVCVRLTDDYGVVRRKLRVTLGRRAGDRDGILCVENETRTVPAGRYVVEFNDREMFKAVERSGTVEVRENAKTEVVLRIKDDLVPLAVHIDMPAVLIGQIAVITLVCTGQKDRKSTTRGVDWLTWVPEGVYEVTVETPGCSPAFATAVVTKESPGLVQLKCEPTN
ncbi:MAG: hypothetical protein ABL997_19575, partial [Planctomycetota bacterium]